MRNRFAFLFTLLFVASGILAQNGHEIKVKLNNFEEKELYLGYHYGDKQYFRDSVEIGPDGYFVFSGEEELEGGVYLIILPPDNMFFEVLVNKGDQHFSVEANAKELIFDRKIEGSKDNQLFHNYTSFLNTKGKKVGELRTLYEAEKQPSKKKELEDQIEAINQEVKAYQEKVVTENPGTLTAATIKTSWDVNVPKLEGPEDVVKMKRFQYYREHFFDNIDLGDGRLIRGPLLFKKVNQYVDNLTYQHPDSITKAVDFLLQKMKPSDENFRFFVVHFLNKYAKSKFVGMDAVYVHLAQNYYCNGVAWWVDDEQKEKICKNATTLEPILIGKTAPNIKMQLEDGSKLDLHDVKSEYTVLFFWDPDCGHCKKSMPKVIEFYDKYHGKGVEMFAVCTKVTKDVPKCWEMIKEKKMGEWINVVDPYMLSKYKAIYDIRTTPRIFILDKEKKIVSKGIGGEQLDEVMERILGNETIPLQKKGETE